MIIKPTIFKNPQFQLLTASQKHILLTCMVRANQDTGILFPSYSQLEADTTLVRNTVISSIKQLRALGWLTLVSRGNRDGQANQYRVNIPDAKGGSAMDALGGQGVVLQEDQGSASIALGVVQNEVGGSASIALGGSAKYAPLTDKKNREENKEKENKEEENREEKKEEIPQPINTPFQPEVDIDFDEVNRDLVRNAFLREVTPYGYQGDFDLFLSECKKNGIEGPSTYFLNQEIRNPNSLVTQFHLTQISGLLRAEGISKVEKMASFFITCSLKKEDPVSFLRDTTQQNAFIAFALDKEKTVSV